MSAQLDELPPRERVVVHCGWRVVHAFDTSLPGWLCVLPRRHVTSLAELEADEASALGPLLRAGSAALQEVLACEKTYAMLFAEREGFAHLHFHLVPRMADFDATVVGPAVFAFLGRPEDERVPHDEMDGLALELRASIEARL